jgi:signal transduction histidine kinase
MGANPDPMPYRFLVSSTLEKTQLRSTGRAGPFARWPRASDAALAFAVFVLSIFILFGEDMWETLGGTPQWRPVDEVTWTALLVSAIASGSLLWRRTRPLVILALLIGLEVLPNSVAPTEATFAVPFALYSAGRYGENDRWNFLLLAAEVVIVSITTYMDNENLAEFVLAGVFVFGFWYVGRRIRFRGQRLAEREERRREEVLRTVAEERTRIARELHDVVAHRVSLMTVQAGAARTIATDDPEKAAEAMGAVEQAGREVLGELRHLLGVLRPDAEGDLFPQPGLIDIPHLVDEFNEAGLEVTLSVHGEEIELPVRVELAVYRIVQEALTNALRHAGPDARAMVRLEADGEGVRIEVTDDGIGATPGVNGGHGIVGMRERAQLLGGSFHAGPGPRGGYSVSAYLPVEEDSP